MTTVRSVAVPFAAFALLSTALLAPLLAADPPPLVNYQGVLRDAFDRPLDGDVDMVFRFMSSPLTGSEILVDSHTLAAGGRVRVTGGVFNVELGAGAVTDGSGPGTYTSLEDVFRDYGSVFLAIRVGTEDLSPRVRIASAGYALNATYAGNADTLDGQSSAAFLNTSSSAQTKTGRLELESTSGYGIEASGPAAGGFFADRDGSGSAEVGWGDDGIRASGSSSGGVFRNLDTAAECSAAYLEYGVSARGPSAGGYFLDTDGTGYAFVGVGEIGVRAYGADAGGYFSDSDGSGVASAGVGDTGVSGSGSHAGAHFTDADGTGEAFLGYGSYGVWGNGLTAGGYFFDDDASGRAYVGYGSYGVHAEGSSAGGRFEDSDASGYATLGSGHYGVLGYGDSAGGYFYDLSDATYAYVGYLTYKITGNGSMNFVQNHPEDAGKVISYAAPEGDEVGVYTRGTARLVDGEARVALGETFRWVANPDLGLTVHLTPVGAWSDLYVAEKSTTALVVRSAGGARDAAFDYLVHGLRIGFEEASVVQPKQVESYIPSMKDHRALYEAEPGLRSFTARARFEAMNAGASIAYDAGLSAASALAAAIHVYDPATDGPAVRLRGAEPSPPPGAIPAPAAPASAAIPAPAAIPASAFAASAPASAAIPASAYAAPGAIAPAGPAAAAEIARAQTRLPVSEPVEAGDLLVLDPLNPGRFARARAAADPLAAAIAASASESVDGELEVVVCDTLYAAVKADASTAPIGAGDLLVASALPGHVMKAPPGAPAGAIVGKALGPLAVGQGLVRILVTLR